MKQTTALEELNKELKEQDESGKAARSTKKQAEDQTPEGMKDTMEDNDTETEETEIKETEPETTTSTTEGISGATQEIAYQYTKALHRAADYKMMTTIVKDPRACQMYECMLSKYAKLAEGLEVCVKNLDNLEMLDNFAEFCTKMAETAEKVYMKRKEILIRDDGTIDLLIKKYLDILLEIQEDIEDMKAPIMTLAESIREKQAEDKTPEGMAAQANPTDPPQWVFVGDVPGYEKYGQLYTIDNTGRITNTKTGKELKQFINANGYLITQLHCKGERHTVRVHMIVARAFVPNPKGYPVVNHIDTNKTNPTASNLEWVTISENARHAIENNCWTTARQVKEVCPSTGKVLHIWPAIAYAARHFKVSWNVVKRLCEGQKSKILSNQLEYV